METLRKMEEEKIKVYGENLLFYKTNVEATIFLATKGTRQSF